jgi:adenylate cyclase
LIRSAGIGLLVALVFILLSRVDLFRTFELKTLDARFSIAGRRAAKSPVAIVFIGDDSIEAFGRWPWSWEYHALLVDALSRAGAERIFFDILFTEKPKDGEAEFFAGTAALTKNVYLGSYFERLVEQHGAGRTPLFAGQALRTPVTELRKAAVALGHCNVQPDLDGSIRRLPLLVGYEGGFYPAAPLLLAAEALGMPRGAAALGRDGRHVELRRKDGTTLAVPVDADGQTLINYLGGMEAIPSYSFRQVLQSDQHPGSAALDLSVFKGKTVLVGVTFAGNTDQRPTPFSKVYPMTAVQATVLENILAGEFVHTPAPLFTVVLWLLGATAFGAATFHFRPLASLALSAAAGGAYLGTALAAFQLSRWNLELVGPLLTIAGTYTTVTAVRYFADDRESRKIRRMFSSYMTERVVKELIARPELAALGGQRREITVLFTDIWGFTPFSERYSAEEVVARLNEFLDAMAQVIIHWEGTIDKFVGDAIVAFWGAPLQQADHAERAIRCALHMILRLEELQRQWERQGKEPFEIGIGINTGEVIVGNIGSEGRKMDYTVIGDVVNAGARLEKLTRKHQCRILVTGITLEQARPLIESGKLGHLSITWVEKAIVKGKAQPLDIYELHTIEPGAKSELAEGKRTA